MTIYFVIPSFMIQRLTRYYYNQLLLKQLTFRLGSSLKKDIWELLQQFFFYSMKASKYHRYNISLQINKTNSKTQLIGE